MAKLMAIIGAIKQIASIVEMVKNMYDKYIEGQIHKHYEKKRKVIENVEAKVRVEVKKPKEEQDDEKLKELHRKLVNLGLSK